MTPDPNIERIFDGVAEALIMVDTQDAETVAELAERLEELCILFDVEAKSDHPCARALAAARRLEAGDTSALNDIQTAYSTCRIEVDSAVKAELRASAQEPAATQPEAPTETAASAPRRGTKRAAAATAAPEAATAPAPRAMPLAGDEELLRDFAVRAAEHMDDADERLLALEADTSDAGAIDAVFRAFHTIKGMAGFLALDDICTHAHDSESILANARNDGSAIGPSDVQALFSAVDRMRALVAAAIGIAPEPATPSKATRVTRPAETPAASDTASAAPADASSASTSVRAGTVRVEESRLDALLDTIGEMVIAESMVSASTLLGADAATIEAQVERLDKIARELQQMATSLRMVPLRATFRQMARLVRDVAAKAGKQVDFVISGEDTELDKIVVDRISDPLVHALRNAVDHGIETPEERRAAGKPETGRVELRAYHAGGAIHVEISDDGRGLDAEAILSRARTMGMVAADERPEDDALFDMVYQPGFSTAQEITDVSGRGVGMDVVRRTIQELRGRIDLRSTPAQGTTMEIRLPLTLAIIDSMILRVGEERYALPMLSIERSVRPTAEQIATVTGRGEMLTLGERLIPILRLHEMFGTADAVTDPTQAVVVIVDDNGAYAGLLACELLGQQQTVIKPLGDGLPDQPGITGASIMPDGRVGLILDASGLVRISQGRA